MPNKQRTEVTIYFLRDGSLHFIVGKPIDEQLRQQLANVPRTSVDSLLGHEYVSAGLVPDAERQAAETRILDVLRAHFGEMNVVRYIDSDELAFRTDLIMAAGTQNLPASADAVLAHMTMPLRMAVQVEALVPPVLYPGVGPMVFTLSKLLPARLVAITFGTLPHARFANSALHSPASDPADFADTPGLPELLRYLESDNPVLVQFSHDSVSIWRQKRYLVPAQLGPVLANTVTRIANLVGWSNERIEVAFVPSTITDGLTVMADALWPNCQRIGNHLTYVVPKL